MPGGRLTERERQQIGSWLHDGLAYAEMARHLGRPTSTVTREVLRNGGPAAYRADLAQHATQRRRRRRAPSRPGRTPPPDGRDADAVSGYEERFAAVFVQAGLPRMTARVLACLYTSDTEGLGASELARRLQVSPASISKAVALLESQSQIRRERDDRRRDRYIVDDDVLYQSAMASARATAHLGAVARQGVGVLGPDTPAGARLATVAGCAEFVSERIALAAEQARELMRPAPISSP